MIRVRSLVISISLAVLSMPLVYAQDLSTYRRFQLGMNLPAAAKQANAKPSEVQMIYQRPAVIQEMEWRPQGSDNTSAQEDPVEKVSLGFYNGELYRIVVSYNRNKTEGLTDADIIESISTIYGTPTTPVATIISSSSSQKYGDQEKVIARWEDSEYSLNLFHYSYWSVPGMLAYSKRLDTLAQEAIVEAIRLNEQEAPQREIDRQNREDEEKRAAEQEARPVNKANFRP